MEIISLLGGAAVSESLPIGDMFTVVVRFRLLQQARLCVVYTTGTNIEFNLFILAIDKFYVANLDLETFILLFFWKHMSGSIRLLRLIALGGRSQQL